MFRNIYNAFFKQYYLLFILLHFITFNLLCTNLIVSGILYYLYLITLNIITIIIIIKHNNSLKFKEILYIFFILNIIFSKNILYVSLLIIIILLISILNFKNNQLIKLISILTPIITFIICIIIIANIQLIFFIVILFSNPNNDIHENTHYYCNNYEIYSYYKGSIDSFNYTVIKNYKIININNIIEIKYNKRIGDTLEEYNKVLENNKCRLVGE